MTKPQFVSSNMPKDDSAFTWFCAEMTDIHTLYQIARESKPTDTSSFWGYV